VKKHRRLLLHKALTRKGICIKYATADAARRTSYLCDDCQSLDSVENILNELEALRRGILKKRND
jgi:hypothetical protein